ncbi:MAG TPA: YncE family protein [Pyrinomonadaceae bacterium]|nr:YncE family protein [Pyrinomonadaceae bacterium]
MRFFVSLLLTIAFAGLCTAQQKPATPQTFTAEGVSIEFSVDPGPSGQLIAGEDATVKFKIAGTNGSVPLSNLRPVAWIDQRTGEALPTARECREKVQSFLQSSFTKRPTLDLNAYFILALNNEANISVIDPLSGFGGSKLYTLIPLKSPGEDWVMSRDSKRLYVSMPQVNQVAVIDVRAFKVIANVDAGVKPSSVALQHDERYLWIGNNGANADESGITVIDTAGNKVVAQLKTGAGHHEIVLNDDDTVAFVTNKDAGTLTVVDVRKLAVLKELKVGAQPTAMAYSSLGKTVYVANEGDGNIVAVGGAGHNILARIEGDPGMRTVRISPDGRFGFAVNTAKGLVHVFDLASNRVIHTVAGGPGADQISFSRQFAYIRAAGSESVSMIRIADLGKDASLTKVPAGQKAPAESRFTSLADAIVPAPEDGAVLIANPADKMIYYYTEGMAAPMGSFQNYKRDPRALLVVDNSLRETQHGVYTTTARLNGGGNYDVVFLLDAPRVINCFNLTVAGNPALPQKTEAVKIDPLAKEALARVGEKFTLRFRLLDLKTGNPKLNLEDVRVLVFLAPGIWQQRELAKSTGEGVYEASFVPPNPGVYYVFVQSATLGLEFNQTTPLTLSAIQ